MKRRIILLSLLLSTLLPGCGSGPTPAPAPAPTPAPAPVPAPAEPSSQAPPAGSPHLVSASPPPAAIAKPAKDAGAALLPTRDLQHIYEVWATGAGEPQRVVEALIRLEDRVVVTADGKPYATWIIKDGSVWRLDPGGGGALLRYLPPKLERGQYWKQTSGDAEVFFALDTGGDLCMRVRTTGPCWTLQVLNRGQLTEFAFEEGLGPLAVVHDDLRNPAGSSRKMAQQSQPVELTQADRDGILKAVPASQGLEAAIAELTPEAFKAALEKEPVLVANLDGAGKEEQVFIQGERLRVADADGRTLLEAEWPGAPYSDEARVKAERFDLPDRPPLVRLEIKYFCFKGGPASVFLWYDAGTGRYQVTPEPDCTYYQYKGHGQFERHGGSGTPLPFTESVRWADGAFVATERRYGLVLRSVTAEQLGWVLEVVAAEAVEGEERLFANANLARAFEARLDPGTWRFTDPESFGEQIRFRASLNGQPRGYLTVRTGPPTDPGEAYDPETVQIHDLAWSD